MQYHISILASVALILHLTHAQSPTSDNVTCHPELAYIPMPLTPGSSLQHHGNYVAPDRGMIIIGDTCMVFCGETTNTEKPVLETPVPALHPLFGDISMRTRTVLGETTTSTKPRSTVLSTTHMTKLVNPSYTELIVGGETPSTKWVVGGAQPTTLPPGASPTFPVRKRQESVGPSTPKLTAPSDPKAAVYSANGNCITMCPNAMLKGTLSTPMPRVSEARVSDGKKHLPQAIIALAIVLPVLSTLAALVAEAMLLKYRRTIKVLRNERNRNKSLFTRWALKSRISKIHNSGGHPF